ncbi:hypothetical protein MLD38_000910 [Melastoma candidum]|uniref:Uncharacterized protein n=1 Tax=Melastoma candidum TaxID=119954 RepID=A0ACB9SEW6_9MYRT|nr:hypothetical protein MLD38_000910 [Melastoma candidum]
MDVHLSFQVAGRFLSCQSDCGEPRAELRLVAASGSEIDSPYGLRVVPSTLAAAEKGEAKAVLALFLKTQGLSNAVAVRTVNKSDLFCRPPCFEASFRSQVSVPSRTGTHNY